MLRVRERALAKVSPRVKQALDRLLAAQKASTAGLALDLLPLAADLQGILDAQMAALRGEQMSLSEYQWLLGLAIRAALEKGEEAPGVDYWGILRKVEHLTGTFPETQGRVRAAEAYQAITKAYAGYAMDQPGVLQELVQPDPAAYAIDLLTVAARWAPAMEERSQVAPPLSASGKH
jgi:hypothetical protein